MFLPAVPGFPKNAAPGKGSPECLLLFFVLPAAHAAFAVSAAAPAALRSASGEDHRDGEDDDDRGGEKNVDEVHIILLRAHLRSDGPAVRQAMRGRTARRQRPAARLRRAPASRKRPRHARRNSIRIAVRFSPHSRIPLFRIAPRAAAVNRRVLQPRRRPCALRSPRSAP